MKRYALLVVLALAASPLLAQNSTISGLTTDSSPLSTDMFPLQKVGDPRAKKTTLGSIATFATTSLVDSRIVRVNCAGTNDTAAINAAVTTAQTSGSGSGAVLHLSGSCVYSGAGISNNPTAGTTQHLVIEGDGPSATTLTMSACSNSQCILLGSQSSVGSGHNDGSGLRDITIVAPASKDAVVIANLERFSLRNVYIYGGLTGLTVSE